MGIHSSYDGRTDNQALRDIKETLKRMEKKGKRTFIASFLSAILSAVLAGIILLWVA